MKGHLKHMVIGGAAILVVLLIFGVEFQRALSWALLLACPLMMVGMMAMMNRKPGAGADGEHDHGSHCGPTSHQTPAERDRIPQDTRPGPEGHTHA